MKKLTSRENSGNLSAGAGVTGHQHLHTQKYE